MRYLVVLTLILCSGQLYSSPAEEPKTRDIPILETIQELFGTQANFVANRLDSFFATERADDEFGRSRIRVRSQFNLRERETSDLDTNYRINLRLPSLEEKFKYEYYKNKNKDQVTTEDQKEFVKSNKLKSGWIFNSDIGVVVALPPKLVTRARVRNNFTTGTLIHRVAEQLTYTTDESGLVEETSIDSDHAYTENFLFRFINYKRWQVLQKDFNTNHGPSWLHRVSEDDAFIYSFTMQTKIDSSVWYTNNYRLGINYRRNLYKQWIYFDVIPGLDFPKEWSFRRTPFLNFQIEFLFGS